jgi:hypothetical protein
MRAFADGTGSEHGRSGTQRLCRWKRGYSTSNARSCPAQRRRGLDAPSVHALEAPVVHRSSVKRARHANPHAPMHPSALGPWFRASSRARLPRVPHSVSISRWASGSTPASESASRSVGLFRSTAASVRGQVADPRPALSFFSCGCLVWGIFEFSLSLCWLSPSRGPSRAKQGQAGPGRAKQ